MNFMAGYEVCRVSIVIYRCPAQPALARSVQLPNAFSRLASSLTPFSTSFSKASYVILHNAGSDSTGGILDLISRSGV